MKGRVLDKCMVQTNGDHGQKGMVGMAKGIGGIILELHKRECLMSLLECGDHMLEYQKSYTYPYSPSSYLS
jgi:hypothetical protein